MESVFFYCAVVGGGLLVLQTLLLLLGGDSGGDADLDLADAAGGPEQSTAAHEGFLKVLSIKTIVAFATFFGLVGLAGNASEWSPTTTLLAASGAGLAAVWLVAWLMSSLARLQSSGTVRMRNALGSRGVVYLPVPGGSGGTGRVTLTVQGRRIECTATTAGTDLATGTPIRVIRVDGSTVEVEPVPG